MYKTLTRDGEPFRARTTRFTDGNLSHAIAAPSLPKRGSYQAGGRVGGGRFRAPRPAENEGERTSQGREQEATESC